jgi:hypothetical protein
MTTRIVVIVQENASVLKISGDDGQASPAHHPQRRILLRNFWNLTNKDYLAFRKISAPQPGNLLVERAHFPEKLKIVSDNVIITIYSKGQGQIMPNY